MSRTLPNAPKQLCLSILKNNSTCPQNFVLLSRNSSIKSLKCGRVQKRGWQREQDRCRQSSLEREECTVCVFVSAQYYKAGLSFYCRLCSIIYPPHRFMIQFYKGHLLLIGKIFTCEEQLSFFLPVPIPMIFSALINQLSNVMSSSKWEQKVMIAA